MLKILKISEKPEQLEITTINLKEIREILKPLRHLCEEPIEWGGYIDSKTGKIEMLGRGDEESCERELTLTEHKEEHRSLEGFHVHQDNSPPSFLDVCVAHFVQNTEYVITRKGIYAIYPNSKLISFWRFRMLECIWRNHTCKELSLKLTKKTKKKGVTTFLAESPLINSSDEIKYVLAKTFPVKIVFISW